jgi:hypothetical protein
MWLLQQVLYRERRNSVYRLDGEDWSEHWSQNTWTMETYGGGTDVQKYSRTDVQMYRSTDVQKYRRTEVHMYRCTDVQKNVAIERMVADGLAKRGPYLYYCE